jgi:L-ascorbate metabolism protein UlaG (beta-lactamase superfamily)
MSRRSTYALIILILLMIGIPTWIQFHWAVSGYQGNRTDHFDGQRFHNLTPYTPKSIADIITWRLNRHVPPWPKQVKNGHYPIPSAQIQSPKTVSVTFINHATLLIQMKGLNILTDPIWQKRASPLSWFGPKRVRAPGIKMDQLPPIDLIIISHNHYDHMDIPTLLALQKRFHPIVLTGLGNDDFLHKQGINRVKGLDWWQKVIIKQHTLFFVPTQHFSGRSLSDRNNTLWGSFIIQSPKGPIYFAGDTGWGPQFKQIKKRFGPLFLALLPIGAYLPRSIMKPVHINPDEAVKTALKLNAHYAIGMHFDTFEGLADEPFGDAKKRLNKALDQNGLDHKHFITLGFGQSRVFATTAEKSHTSF